MQCKRKFSTENKENNKDVFTFLLREVNKNNLLGEQFLIFMPKKSRKTN